MVAQATIAPSALGEDRRTTHTARMLLGYLETPGVYVRARYILVFYGVLLLVAGLFECAVIIPVAWQGWTTGVWTTDSSWFIVVPAIMFLLALICLVGNYRPHKALTELLRARLTGDDTSSLPLFPTQPASLSEGDVPPFPAHIGPLHGLNDSLTVTRRRVNAFSRLLLGMALCAFAVWPLSAAFGTTDLNMRSLLIGCAAPLVIVGLALLRAGVYSWRRARMARRGMMLLADEHGLHWRDARTINRRTFTRERAIAWSEITAFLAMPLAATRRQDPCTIYLIATRRETLHWVMPFHPTQAEAQVADHFARLIVTHTRLALRDMTSLVLPEARALSIFLARSPGRRARLLRDRGIDIPRDVVSEKNLALFQRRRTWLRVGEAALLLAALAFALAQPIIQANQARTYDLLLTRARTATPIFADTLTHHDPYWLPLSISGSQGQVTSTPDGHVLSGQSGYYVLEMAMSTFTEQSTAISVDVRQQQVESGTDGAGIALRYDPAGETLVVFYVASDGYWQLARRDVTYTHPDGLWTKLLDGQGAPLHEAGGSNTVSVIVRGTSDYCYINGNLVGFVTNDTAPTTGKIGIYNDDGAFPATFTNFAVYPVN